MAEDLLDFVSRIASTILHTFIALISKNPGQYLERQFTKSKLLPPSLQVALAAILLGSLSSMVRITDAPDTWEAMRITVDHFSQRFYFRIATTMAPTLLWGFVLVYALPKALSFRSKARHEKIRLTMAAILLTTSLALSLTLEPSAARTLNELQIYIIKAALSSKYLLVTTLSIPQSILFPLFILIGSPVFLVMIALGIGGTRLCLEHFSRRNCPFYLVGPSIVASFFAAFTIPAIVATTISQSLTASAGLIKKIEKAIYASEYKRWPELKTVGADCRVINPESGAECTIAAILKGTGNVYIRSNSYSFSLATIPDQIVNLNHKASTIKSVWFHSGLFATATSGGAAHKHDEFDLLLPKPDGDTGLIMIRPEESHVFKINIKKSTICSRKNDIAAALDDSLKINAYLELYVFAWAEYIKDHENEMDGYIDELVGISWEVPAGLVNSVLKGC